MSDHTFAPVREAYKLWLRTAPQLTLEVDDLTRLPDAATPPGAHNPGCGRASGSTAPATATGPGSSPREPAAGAS